MGEIQKIRIYIEYIRKHLQDLIKLKDDLTDSEIVEVSQELDKVLNIYHKMTNRQESDYKYA